MNILFFSPYFYPYTSGLTTYPLHILFHLAAKHHITVLTFKHQPNLPDQETHQGLKIIRLPYWFRLSKGFISPQSVSIFRHHLQHTDRVFLNLPSVEGLPLAFMANQTNIPVISLAHCEIDLGPSFFSRLLTWSIDRVVAAQCRLSQTIIAYTQDYVNSTRVLAHFQTKIKYTFPPVSTPKANQATSKQFQKQKGNAYWIGFSGRTAREKGLEYLVHALSAVKFDRPVKLICAGPYGKQVAGEAAYYQHLLTLLKQSKLSYQFLGNLDLADLGAFYQNLDVLVLPSINQTEAFGMVQVEAMLLGTPVIASDLPGVRIPVKKTGMGLIVPPKDVSALTQSITQIISHRSRYTSASLVAKAQSIFNINQVYRFYDQLFQA